MTSTAKLKQQLLVQKADLENRIDLIKQSISRPPETADWAELATERENDEVIDALGNAAVKELEQVKMALSRIETGQYFKCSQCHKAIGFARLTAMPFASRCRQCADSLH